MPEIVVTVKNKMAVGDGSVIVCNNSDYVVRFVLDSEWDALALRTMRIVYDSYTHTDIAFSGDTVALPTIIDRTSIGIGLYSGDIHTSTCAMFDCERSVMGKNSNAVVPPSSDVYNEIVEMINDGRLKGDKGDKGDPGARGYKGDKGDPGADGADGVTFTPSVDSAGNLSWTNDGGLSNPATVNIKGDPGAPGKDGSDANVTAANIETALGYVPVTPSDLAAKQDALTDADRQSITKTGMTTGAAWTSAEQKAARDRMGVDKEYELIEEITLTENVTQFTRTDEPDGTAYAFEMVAIKINRTNTGAGGVYVFSGSTVLGWSYIAETGQHFACETFSLHGYWQNYRYSASSSHNDYNNIAPSGDSRFLKIKKVAGQYVSKIQITLNDGGLGIGTKISIYGVRA